MTVKVHSGLCIKYNWWVICSVVYSDIFRQPIWQDLTAIDDLELSILAEFLPAVVLKGRAP